MRPLIPLIETAESLDFLGKEKITMNKAICILFLLFVSFNVCAEERYYCGAMSGVNTPLNKPSFLKKIKLLFTNGVEKTETLSDFVIVIDGDNSYIQDVGNPEKTPLLLFTNTDEKAELLSIGTVASSIYSIDKIRKKILQAKNGILPTNLYNVLKIDLPYQMIMSSDCR